MDRLRPYPVMKHSGFDWLGEIPAHWEGVALRRYCQVFAGATPSRARQEYWNGGTVPWLASGDVNLRRIVRANQFITQAGHAASSTKWIRPGSLVVALAGQGRTKGMVATVECRTTCNQSLAAIEPSPHVSDYSYLAYYLESRYRDIRSLVGDGLRDGLNLEHVRAIPTPLPPLREQTAIARFLDHATSRVDRSIGAKEKLIALLGEQKRAIIHEAVTGQIDVRTGRPYSAYKESRVEGIATAPEHWSVVACKHVLSRLVDCEHKTAPAVAESDYFVVRTTAVRDGSLDWSGTYATDDASYSEWTSRCRPTPGDVIFTREAPAGEACLVPEGYRVCLGQRTVLMRPDATYDPRFLIYMIYGGPPRWRIRQSSQGSTVGHFNMDDIGAMPVLVPPLEEQKGIVQFVAHKVGRIDQARKGLTKGLDVLREFQTRLVADVVAGKLDVRQPAADLEELSVVGGIGVRKTAPNRTRLTQNTGS